MNARNEVLSAASGAPLAVASQAATRYMVVPLAMNAFGYLNDRNQVAFNESLGNGRFMARFYDGRMIRSLGTLGGDSAQVAALNNFEQITGSSRFNTSDRVHAFRWSPMSGMVDLGVIRGGDESAGSDINNLGEVAGTVSFTDGRRTRAVLWRPGAPARDLGLDNGVAAFMRINDRGQVGGTAFDASGRGQVFQWTRSDGALLMRDPDVIDGELRDMNASGQVTGSYSSVEAGGPSPFLWTPGGEFRRLFDQAAFPFALNDHAMVVGVLLDQIAFVWTREHGMTDIGALPGGGFSNAYDVNNRGEVVGQAATSTSLHAFYWTREGGMVDLNDRLVGPVQDLELSIAFDINQSGAIVAGTTDARLVLLVPVGA